MTHSTYTPGPWNVIGHAILCERDPIFSLVRVVSGRKRVAVVAGIGEDETLANASLVAAAPALYEVLKRVQAIAPGFHDIAGVHYNEAEAIFNQVQEALAQAEGKE